MCINRLTRETEKTSLRSLASSVISQIQYYSYDIPKPKAPKTFNENPDWSKADFKNTIARGSVSLAEAVKAVRRGRGPQKQPKKVAISIRLNSDIIKHFKAGGAGWQSRMEAVLEKASVGRKA